MHTLRLCCISKELTRHPYSDVYALLQGSTILHAAKWNGQSAAVQDHRDDPLVAPCRCDGSLRYVHNTCQQAQFNLVLENAYTALSII